MTDKRVLVLNHFAVPRGYPGGTRHVELFGRVPGWSHLIVASRLNMTTGRRQEDEKGFSFVPITPHKGNGLSRVLSWISYGAAAIVVGLRQARVDVVYASSPHLLAGLAGWAIARVKRKKLILEVRDLWPQVLLDMGQVSERSVIYKMLKATEALLYRSAAAIVVMSAGSQAVLERDPAARGKTVYIPNGADPGDFVPSAPRDLLRERYGFHRLTAVYAGAHGPANGLDFILSAASALMEADLDIVLVGDGVEKERLAVAAIDRDLTNVRFMSPIPKSEMADLLAAADIGLHVLADVPLFRYGVSPNKVFDYMASALPVITNSPGVVGDIVADAECGWVVEAEDLEAGLRAALSRSAAELVEYGSSGREWVRSHSSREGAAQTLRELLEAQVVSGGARL